MNYITTKEASKICGVTNRMIVPHCSTERINGNKKIENTWSVLADTKKTADGRYRRSKVKDGENK